MFVRRLSGNRDCFTSFFFLTEIHLLLLIWTCLFTESPLVSMQRYQISYCNSSFHYNSVVRTPGYVPVVSINRQFHSTELSGFIFIFLFFRFNH